MPHRKIHTQKGGHQDTCRHEKAVGGKKRKNEKKEGIMMVICVCVYVCVNATDKMPQTKCHSPHKKSLGGVAGVRVFKIG